MRIWKVGDNPSPFGDLSLLIVDMYVRNLLICSLLRTYISMCYVIKAMPCGASTLTGHLTTNDIISIEVAMSQYITPVTGRNSLTPSQSFRWLFLALERGNPAAKSHRIEATAPNEHSAHLLLVRDYILSFAGRLPVREVTV
ncbi:host cell division inhibitor Icd-like protein [Morganella morganii]|uniref:host cell division inhibitor Icd-like protein n=1 Tax=Morganella morganii TaxID=582 RepID=UPI0031F5AA7E